MADQSGKFTRPAAKRIIDAVRRIEATPTDRTGRRVSAGGEGEVSFWAQLTTCDMTGSRYSWFRVRPDGTGHWQGYDPMVTGELNAIEINGGLGCTGDIVRLFLTDTDHDGMPRYTFQLEKPDDRQPLRRHDHRDNENGGFAFACFHPGTALPQQPWAI